VQSFAATKNFDNPTDVPTGFNENNFTVPTPADGATLYLKLRDDPSAVAAVTLPVPVQKPASSAASTSPTATPASVAAPSAQDTTTAPTQTAPAPKPDPTSTPSPTSELPQDKN
jgi:hypothetical protein